MKCVYDVNKKLLNFHLSVYNYDVPRPYKSKELGLNLYPLANPDNFRFLYASHWNGTAFINVRYIKDAVRVSKQGISMNSYELSKFKEIRQELELTISELQTGHADCYLGKFKLLRYQADSQELEFHKINVTDDRQEFVACIVLNAEETLAFFATFDTVEREFHQIVADLSKKSASDTPKTPKRKTSDTPATAAPPSFKFVKQEPEYLGPGFFEY